jgi:Phosphatidylinositol 3- and 4-kinase/PI4-kinase N-terminal region/Phosphoinositide 3-kinase family, accessory domain (PIK domain)
MLARVHYVLKNESTCSFATGLDVYGELKHQSSEYAAKMSRQLRGMYPMDTRSEEAILAVGTFVIASGGRHCDILVPLILRYFLQLPYVKWADHDTSTTIHHNQMKHHRAAQFNKTTTLGNSDIRRAVMSGKSHVLDRASSASPNRPGSAENHSQSPISPSKAAHMDALFDGMPLPALQCGVDPSFSSFSHLNTPSAEPVESFTCALTTVLGEIAVYVPCCKQPILSAILELLHLAGTELMSARNTFAEAKGASNSKALRSVRLTARTMQHIVVGILRAIGHVPLPFDCDMSTRMVATLDRLMAHYRESSSSAILTSLSLRVMKNLLARNPNMYTQREFAILYDTAGSQNLRVYPLFSFARRRAARASANGASDHEVRDISLQALDVVLEAISIVSLCGMSSEPLKDRAMSKLFSIVSKTLDAAKQQAGDDWSQIRPWVGSLHVTRKAVRAIANLCVRYPDLVPKAIDYLRKTLMGSRRLARHPQEEELTSVFTQGLTLIMKTELLCKQSFVSTATRSFFFMLLNSMMKDETDHLAMPAISFNLSDDRQSPSSFNGGADSPAFENIVPSSRAQSAGDVLDSAFSNQMTEDSCLAVEPISLIRHTADPNTTEALGATEVRLKSRHRILFALTRLTYLVNDSRVTEQVLPVVVQHFGEHPKHLHVCVAHLVDLALESERIDVFEEIVDLLVSTYRHPFDQGNRYNRLEIPQALYQLSLRLDSGTHNTNDDGDDTQESSTMIHPELCGQMRSSLSRQLVRLFCELGRSIASSTKSNGYKSKISVMGALLPTISILLRPWGEYGRMQRRYAEFDVASAGVGSDTKDKDTEESTDSEEASSEVMVESIPLGTIIFESGSSNIRWFKRFWFYVSLLGFVDSSRSGGSHSTGTVGNKAAAAATTTTTTATSSGALRSFHDEVVSGFQSAAAATVAASAVALQSRDEWVRALGEIAINSPILVDPCKQLYFVRELESIASGQGFKEIPRDVIHRRLAVTLGPSHQGALSAASRGELMYLLAVYELELLRIMGCGAGRCYSLIGYAAAEGIQGTVIADALTAMLQAIYNVYLDTVAVHPATPEREEAIAKDAVFLLLHCCSRFDLVRPCSRDFLQRLTSRFPQLQWNSLAVSTALELIEHLHDATNTGDSLVLLEGSPSLTIYQAITLNHSATLDQVLGDRLLPWLLPGNLSVRADILSHMTDVATAWLQNAKFLVPKQSQSVLQQYALSVQYRHSNRLYDHQGLALVLQIESSDCASGASNSSTEQKGSIANLLSALGMKQRYLGEIQALYERYVSICETNNTDIWKSQRSIFSMSHSMSQVALNRQESSPSTDMLPFGKMLSRQLKRDFDELWNEYRMASAQNGILHPADGCTRDNSSVNSRFFKPVQRFLYRSAALIVWSSGRNQNDEQHNGIELREILHLLCKAPTKLFCADIMSSAVAVWEWVLAADPSLRMPLFVEIKAAFAFTVDNGIGLFSAERTRSSSGSASSFLSCPFGDGTGNNDGASSTAENDTLREDPTVTDGLDLRKPNADNRGDVADHLQPHAIWIRFLMQQFSHMDSLSSDVLSVLAMILHKANARPALLCGERGAFAVRLELLCLGFTLLQTAASRLDVRDRELLRSQLFSAAFHWFTHAPQWHDPKYGPKETHRLAALLVQTCKLVQNEGTYGQGDQDNAGVGGSILETKSNASLHARSAPIAAHSPVSALPRHRQSVIRAPMLDRFHGSNVLNAAATSMSSSSLPGHSLTDDAKSLIYYGEETVPAVAKRARLNSFRGLLLFLLSHELDRLSVWYNPLGVESRAFPDEKLFTTSRTIPSHEWQQYVHTAWFVDPQLATRLAARFPMVDAIKQELRGLVLGHPAAVYHLSEAVLFLIGKKRIASGQPTPELQHLLYWSPAGLSTVLTLLKPPYVQNRVVNAYAVHSLRSHSYERVVFFLPQLVQSIRYDSRSLLREYLIEAASQSILLSHQVVWLCQAELGTEHEDEKAPILDSPTAESIEQLIGDVIKSLGPDQRRFFHEEFDFIDSVTKISGILKPLPTKAARKARIQEVLETIHVPHNQVYLPSNPTSEVLDIIPSSGIPLQSAAKVPILVAFKCKRGPLRKVAPSYSEFTLPGVNDTDSDNASDLELEPKPKAELEPEQAQETGGLEDDTKNSSAQYSIAVERTTSGRQSRLFRRRSTRQRVMSFASVARHAVAAKRKRKQQHEEFVQACIFKVGDDCRQDALALQLIQVCKDSFESVGLDLYLYPYRVMPNRIGKLIGGVIECVPRAQTRDEIGKAIPGSLKKHYIATFGREDGIKYQRALRNFILSMAGYAITSYILQVKDRHNANIMFNNEGHLIHIDFGFIFDISPGQNMRFERAGFKLTGEMIELMGGLDSSMYQWFVHLILQGFLAVREHYKAILSLVDIMTVSGLTCFMPHSMKNLRDRFFPDKDERVG